MIECYALAAHRNGPYRLGYDVPDMPRQFVVFNRREGLPQDKLPDAAIGPLTEAMASGIIVEAKLRDDGKVIYPDHPAFKREAVPSEDRPAKRGRR